MHTRIVIADQYEARCYDVERRDGPWEVAERMIRLVPSPEDDVTFARRIVAALERGYRQLQFEQLVLIAAPPFLDTLSVEFSCDLKKNICAVIPKNLARQTQSTLQWRIPPQAFPASAAGQICRNTQQTSQATPAIVGSRRLDSVRAILVYARQWSTVGARYVGRQLSNIVMS